MRQKLLAFVLITLPVALAGCGDDGGVAGGKWVGEVFTHPNVKSSTVVGEFDSYEDCVAGTQKEARIGIFNCGVK